MAADVLNLSEETQVSSIVNFTDPIVRHDPSSARTVVVKYNVDNRDVDTNGAGRNKNEIDFKKVEGSFIPIVQINTTVVPAGLIQYFKLDYTGFTPELELEIIDSEKDFSMPQTPGLSNMVTVVLTPRVDGQYKSVSLDFYIENIDFQPSAVIYKCRYRCIKGWNVETKQVKFPGCPSKWCQLPLNNHPTTFEFLHEMASSCGLGYATTDQVKEISDDKARLIHNECPFDVMQKHTEFGGLNTESIFDSWIDIYNYLVVINIAWVWAQDLNWNDLGYNPELDILNTSDEIEDPKQTGMSIRAITNNRKYLGTTNTIYTSLRWITDNNDVINNGTTVTPYIGNPMGVGEGNNSISKSSIGICETSIDGSSGLQGYNYIKETYLGDECGDPEDKNTPVLGQKQIHDAFLRKLRTRTLEVIMEKPNFGLQRGTLILVLDFVSSQEAKRNIAQNWNNLGTENQETTANPSSGELEQKIQTPYTPFPNYSTSGVYYIDGMVFEYNNYNQQIEQRLYLLKRSPYVDFQNYSTNTKSWIQNASES